MKIFVHKCLLRCQEQYMYTIYAFVVEKTLDSDFKNNLERFSKYNYS